MKEEAKRQPGELILREYRREDLGEILQLFFDTVHTINKADYTETELWAWADKMADEKAWHESFCSHRTAVAVMDGMIAGFGDMAGDGYLDRLYVHCRRQRQGIGAAICRNLENQAKKGWEEEARSRAKKTEKQKENRKFVTCASITARTFFEKMGYCMVKKQQVERKGILLTNFVMEKEADVRER